MSEHRKTWVVSLSLVALAGGVSLIVLNEKKAVGPAPNVLDVGPNNTAGKSKALGKSSVKWEVSPNLNQPAGRFPLVQKSANPHVKSVVEARATGKHPERLTSLVAPASFDPKLFAESPSKYLNTVEPGRVWQVAQPAANVNPIKSSSPYMTVIDQGGTVSLRVRVTPNAPVTFTSFDGGSFQNLLTSITVQADGQGDASAQMTGTTGVIGDVHILAGSPVDSGQVRFLVHVNPPKLTALEN